MFTTDNGTTKRRAIHIIRYGATLFILLASVSCGKLHLPQLQQLASLPTEPPCRIAILPLKNESAYSKINEIVYKIFMAEIIKSSRLEVIHEGDVRKLYRQLRIYPGQQPNFAQLTIVAARLNAQLLVTGTIIEAKDKLSSRAPNPSLTFTLQLINAQTGRTLWNTYHKRNGQHYQKILHFGIIASLSGLARRMSQEIIDLWTREGLKSCID